jgi:hypothetical protein
VTKDVPDHALMYGNPAKIKAFICECGEKLTLKNEKEKSVIFHCNQCIKDIEVLKKYYEELSL